MTDEGPNPEVADTSPVAWTRCCADDSLNEFNAGSASSAFMIFPPDLGERMA